MFQFMNVFSAYKESPHFSFLSGKAVYIRCLLWLLLPSVIWSFVFGGFYFCAEPFVFPFIEKRLNPKVSFGLKILWIFVFLIAMLASWNIYPAAYHFYFLILMGGAPLQVVFACCIFVFLMCIFLFSAPYRETSAGFKKSILVIGGCFIFMKFMMPILGQSDGMIRRNIIASSPFVFKVLVLDAQSKDNKFLGPTNAPTFLNHLTSAREVPAKIVLMVVESWGESQASLSEVKKNIAQNGGNIIEAGFTDYHGSTLQGEVRELCSQYIKLDARPNFSSFSGDCAPAYMKKKGYEVLGLHGYLQMFYARKSVWKELGIDNSYFRTDLNQLKTCPGRFSGVCDEELIRYGVDLIAGKDKVFLYMLSLSSHEPVASSMLHMSTQYFQNISAVNESQIVARNAVGTLVAALSNKPQLGCTEAYVVGDHQPPSMGNSDQLQAHQVPYIRMSFNCHG